MNRTKRLIGKIGIVLGIALLGVQTGCVITQPGSPGVYVPPPRVDASVSVALPGVEIRAESDFYEPLTPYGRWEVVGSHGRCWIPGRVESDWRPYSDGHWQRTDAGWYWVSDEPWGWATYHYGRWDLSADFGWYWVPQTQWAPAWVSWHEGGGYVGWAPLQPSVRISAGGSVAVDVARIAPQAFVFVEPRRFLQPIHHTTVVVNNTTIINQTVNITNIKVVNNTVINEGPRTQIIEQASGQQVQAVPVRELRRKQEAEVITRQRAASPGREKNENTVQAPVRSEAKPRETRGQSDARRGTKEAEAPEQKQTPTSTRRLENKTPSEPQRRTKEAEASAQEQVQRSAQDAKKATQVESQRRAREASAKAQEDARSKAKDLEKKAQADAQKTARELENKSQVESQRRAKEAEAKAQEDVRNKAKESERIADPKAQQRGRELDKKAPAEAEKKANGRPEPRTKQDQIVKEPGGTNTVKRVQKNRGKGKPSPPEEPAAPPKPSP